MKNKLPKLTCTRYAYYFSEGWEVIWHPADSAKPRGEFTVTIKYNHDRGGDSVSYPYSGPASLKSSIHLIKVAIKTKALPK
jgi:hypothetical protein